MGLGSDTTADRQQSAVGGPKQAQEQGMVDRCHHTKTSDEDNQREQVNNGRDPDNETKQRH